MSRLDDLLPLNCFTVLRVGDDASNARPWRGDATPADADRPLTKVVGA